MNSLYKSHYSDQGTFLVQERDTTHPSVQVKDENQLNHQLLEPREKAINFIEFGGFILCINLILPLTGLEPMKPHSLARILGAASALSKHTLPKQGPVTELDICSPFATATNSIFS